MLNSKFFHPIKQIKIRQCFIYKITPKSGIELNGLLRPSNIPFFSPRPLVFFFTPIPTGFSQVPEKGGD